MWDIIFRNWRSDTNGVFVPFIDHSSMSSNNSGQIDLNSSTREPSSNSATGTTYYIDSKGGQVNAGVIYGRYLLVYSLYIPTIQRIKIFLDIIGI